MKSFIVIGSFMWLLTSCQTTDIQNSSEEETDLSDELPTGVVSITAANEVFTVDFDRKGGYYSSPPPDPNNPVDGVLYVGDGSLRQVRPYENLDSLINRYKKLNTFPPSYSSLSYPERYLVLHEYALAQECFMDRCSSIIRKEVLQAVVDKQKRKYNRERGVYLSWSMRTGVFLMAVILVKERECSAKFIDAETLQEALLFLRTNNWNYDYEANFSNFIVEYSEQFLNMLPR